MLQDFESESKLLIIVVAVSVILAVAGVFLLQVGLGPSSPAPAPISLPQAVEESAAPRDQAELDFAGWQTYRNAEFGFEIRHPKGWMLLSVDSGVFSVGGREDASRLTIVAGTTAGKTRPNMCAGHDPSEFKYWDYAEAIKKASITTRDGLILEKVSSPDGEAHYACFGGPDIYMRAEGYGGISEGVFDKVVSTFEIINPSQLELIQCKNDEDCKEYKCASETDPFCTTRPACTTSYLGGNTGRCLCDRVCI